MADLFDVYEKDTNALIGAIPVSQRDRAQLHRGIAVSIQFHMPRMLHATLGARNGSFELIEIDNRLYVSDLDTEQVKRYIALNADVERAMKQPEIWTDPDAESNSPVR